MHTEDEAIYSLKKKTPNIQTCMQTRVLYIYSICYQLEEDLEESYGRKAYDVVIRFFFFFSYKHKFNL